MRERVIDPGVVEHTKGVLHSFMFMLAGMFFTYNTMAYIDRREKENLANMIVYGPLTVWEFNRVLGHLK